jgi:hypothetical protein
MVDLTTFSTRCKKIDPWILLLPVIQKHLDLVADLNREQLRKGKRSDGTDTPSHSKSPMSEIYVDMKMEAGTYDESIYPAMDFYHFGDFAKAIKAEVTLFDVIIDSFDDKAKELESMYGNTLYGLNKESGSILVSKIIDEYKQALVNYLLN